VRGLAIGIMSGTSLDGADAILADLSTPSPRGIATSFVAFPPELKGRLLDLSAPGSDRLDEAGACSVRLAEIYAEAVARLLSGAGVPAADVDVIGCHGQTVRHRPDLRYTIQLNDAALLAERTGIDVVADFRRRDMAAGGQGAPLVPVFHDAVFRHATRHRAIVNLGGIGNVTSLKPGRPLAGFDCGPGNVLMDGWTKRHRCKDYDEDGAWASEGRVDLRLLARLMDEPFLAKIPPKSTGRELFNETWLLGRINGASPPAADVQATLLEFTAATVVEAIGRFCGAPDEIYLCGGGARNRRLADRIGELARPCQVRPTDDLGVPTGHVETMAFAWLAMKCIRREPLDLASVTGAAHPCILGAVYPA
jgi:anhydro-N-acetylmuramic acid kinase